MASLNKVILIGRLGRDPEVINMDNGTQKMTVTLATSERFHDRNGNWQEQTEWHNIVAWGVLAADIAEHRRNYVKGDLLYIEGRIRTRQYTDKNNVVRHITEVIAEKMMSLTGARPSYNATQTQTASAQVPASVPIAPNDPLEPQSVSNPFETNPAESETPF